MERLNVKPKATKQTKIKKKQPIKVVYISNPVKVEASPTNFRAIVQELTGQDSSITDMMDSRFISGGAQSSSNHSASCASVVVDDESTADFRFDMFDDAFTLQILEDFQRMPR